MRRALGRCELVVVSDIVADTDTNAHAHVLLPALGWGEKDGTVTNSESGGATSPNSASSTVPEPTMTAVVGEAQPKKVARDVFAYVIHEGKVRAPAGAMELIARVT